MFMLEPEEEEAEEAQSSVALSIYMLDAVWFSQWKYNMVLTYEYYEYSSSYFLAKGSC